MPVNAIALFCEDIRQEANGIETLIGILPDQVQIMAPPPSGFHKLGIYVRLTFTNDCLPQNAFVVLEGDDGTELTRNLIDQSTIAETLVNRQAGDLLGVKTIMVLSPFVMNRDGSVRVMVEVDDLRIFAGQLQLEYLSPDQALGNTE